MKKKIEQTLISMEVASMVEKGHKELLRDIRRYVGQLGQSKIAPSDFFQETTYKNSQNKTQPCYNITKKGCEFIAHKLTGVKGTAFTARYINRFHEMEEIIENGEHITKHQPTQKLYKGVPVVTVRDIVNHTGIPKSLIRTALKNCTLNKDYWLLKSVELLSFRQAYPEYRIAKHLFVIAESGVKKLAKVLKFKPNALVTTTVPIEDYPETVELVPKVDYDAFLKDLQATKIYMDILDESYVVKMQMIDNVYRKHGVKMDIPSFSNPWGRVKCALEEIQRVIVDYPELCFVKSIENALKRHSNITENGSKFPMIDQLERNFIGGLLNFKLNTIESTQ